MNKITNYSTVIDLISPHPQITMLQVQVSRNMSCRQAVVKWILSHDTNLKHMDVSDICVLVSYKPIVVLNGLAALEIFPHNNFNLQIWSDEEFDDLMEFVTNLTGDDLIRMTANANTLRNKMEVFQEHVNGNDEVKPMSEIFTVEHLIELQLYNKNPCAEVNMYILKQYGDMDDAQLSELHPEMLNIVRELKKYRDDTFGSNHETFAWDYSTKLDAK